MIVLLIIFIPILIPFIGISTGNASVFTQILMFMITFFVGRYLWYFEGYTTGFGDEKRAKNQRELGDVIILNSP